MRSGGRMGAFFSMLTTALLLSACLAVAGLTACAPRITAPAAEVAAGAVGGTGYRFLHWNQGLAIMIWYDFRGDSGSSSSSSGGGLGAPSTYTIHGYAESEAVPVFRFEWEVETRDGKTALFQLDGGSYDLSQGTLFIVRMEHGRPDVIQLERNSRVSRRTTPASSPSPAAIPAWRPLSVERRLPRRNHRFRRHCLMPARIEARRTARSPARRHLPTIVRLRRPI